MPKVTVQNYLSLIKFSHTVFALPFAFIGFILGTQYSTNQLSLKLLVLIVLCMVFARSAAMAFNRYIDRDIDKINPRTFVREIPAGLIRPNAALAFVLINSALFVLCTYFINQRCFFLSPIALLVILGYSYSKRFTPLCHLILGAGLALAPIGSYLAVTGQFAPLPLYFSFAVLFWVSGFDIIYSLQDEEFDRANNLRSIPVMMGKLNALKLAQVFHFISGLLIITAGLHAPIGWLYWMGTFVFILLLVYQHSLVSVNDLSRLNLAFLQRMELQVFYLLSFLFWIISIDATYMLLNEFFSPLVYDWVVFPLIIFLARMTDVSLGTLRSVLASKGKKKIVPFIGFVEVLIWLFAISSILQNLHSITSYLAWAGGYATGIYLGLVIEEKLAIGNQVMRIITNQDCEKLIETIKQANFGITVLDGHGARGPVKLIFIVLKRKEVENIINLLNLYNPNAFYSVEDIKEANQIRYSTMYQRNNLFNKVFPVRKGL